MEGDNDELLYWPITSFLDHATLCYFQDLIKHFCYSARGTQPEALWATALAGVLSDCKVALIHTASDWLQLTQLPWILLQYLHIAFHNAYDIW